MARVVAAATSVLAVVAAGGVAVAAGLTEPVVASASHGSTRLDAVVGSSTHAVRASAAVAIAAPTHADLAVSAVVATTPAPAAPTSFAVKERYGIDVSWPQCGTALPTIQLDFAVIGLTDGHAESVNPCFAEQVAWARANHLRVAVYVVPNSPGSAATATMRTTARSTAPAACVAVDASCPAYAAGVRQARHAMAAAAAVQLPRTGWWLDVEESAAGTLWGADTVANAALLKGWVDTLRAAHLPVGAYSTHGYWTTITGGWAADLPQWVPVGTDGITDAQAACATPFTTGPVVMTQWLTGPYDGNLLCPTTDGDPMARAFTDPRWAQPTTAGVPALLTTPVPHPELEQAQADQDAASECADPADAAAADPKPRRRVADDPKKDPQGDACATDDAPSKPKTKSKADGKNPKTKGHAKPTKKPTKKPVKAHHATPKSKPKASHHKG